MKQKTLLFIVGIFLCPILTNAQVLKTISEDFDAGRITYQYYEDKNTYAYVKHGTFRMTRTLKQDIGSSTLIVTGSFKNGFRNGPWSFNITKKDYPNSDGSFTTGTTTSIQTFKDGMPYGLWKVNDTWKTRKRTYTFSGYVWGAYSSLKSESATTNFINSVATGLSTYRRNGVTKSLNLNSKGCLTSNIIMQSLYGNTELVINKYGILTKHIERSKFSDPVKVVNYNAENIQKVQDHLDGKIGKEEFAFTFRRVKLLEDLDFSDMFEHDYFLLPSLGGDKTYDGSSSQSNRVYGSYFYVSD